MDCNIPSSRFFYCRLPIEASSIIGYNVLYTQTFVFLGRTEDGGTVLCCP